MKDFYAQESDNLLKSKNKDLEELKMENESSKFTFFIGRKTLKIYLFILTSQVYLFFFVFCFLEKMNT
jgi:hypothetical protein